MFEVAAPDLNTGIAPTDHVLTNPLKDAWCPLDVLTSGYYSGSQLLLSLHCSSIHQALDVTPQEEIQWRQIRGPWWPCDGSSSADPSVWERCIKEVPHGPREMDRCAVVQKPHSLPYHQWNLLQQLGQRMAEEL